MTGANGVDLTLAQSNLRKYGDIYLCLLAGGMGLLHLLAAQADQSTMVYDLLSFVASVVIIILPGYSLSRLVGLEERGGVVFIAISFCSSLAIIGLVGTLFWLTMGTFKPQLVEATLLGGGCFLSVLALLKEKNAGFSLEFFWVRWQALGLMVFCVGFTILMFLIPLPSSPATQYTAFSLNAIGDDNTISVAISNETTTDKTYYIELRTSQTQEQTEPFTVGANTKWQGEIKLPAATIGYVELLLYGVGDNEPLRTLHLQVGETPQLESTE